MFDEYVRGWEIGTPVPDGCCELLIGEFAAPPPKAVRSKESNTQERPRPVETAPAPAVNTKLVASETPQAPPPTLLASTGAQPQKRRLSAEDVNFVLAEIPKKLDYFRVASMLHKQLKRPISEPEITEVLHGIRANATDDLWEVLDTIAERLRDVWQKAEIVESQSVGNVMLLKVNENDVV
jgi:hypothetical protein